VSPPGQKAVKEKHPKKGIRQPEAEDETEDEKRDEEQGGELSDGLKDGGDIVQKPVRPYWQTTLTRPTVMY